MFNMGGFTGAGGGQLDWKVECDDLDLFDWDAAAYIVSGGFRFGHVEGVPEGGNLFAQALRKHASYGGLLIVDDVLTTGTSMEKHRAGREAQGIVLYARGPCPSWVQAVWTLARWAE